MIVVMTSHMPNITIYIEWRFGSYISRQESEILKAKQYSYDKLEIDDDF